MGRYSSAEWGMLLCLAIFGCLGAGSGLMTITDIATVTDWLFSLVLIGLGGIFCYPLVRTVIEELTHGK